MNHFNLAKIDDNQLISYDQHKGVYWQNICEPYDISFALRVAWDKISKELVYKSITGQILKIKLLDKILIKKLSEERRPIFNDNVMFLSMGWSEKSDVGLDSFLKFFGPDSFLAYSGEYGTEITVFLPFIYYLYCKKLLDNRTIVTFKGMHHYYNFMSVNKMSFREGKRTYCPPSYRFPTPNIDEHGARISNYEAYRDFRHDYSGGTWNIDIIKKPIMFLQNKFTVEWNEGPINYLTLNFLDHVFSRFSTKFEIIYSRPGISISKDYSLDMNTFCDYPDTSVAKKYNITVLEDIASDDYNKTKLEILSAVEVFVGVQGGGSFLAAFYKDLNIFILHIRGDELGVGAYEETGFFGYINNNSSRVSVASDCNQLWHMLVQNIPIK